MKERYWCAGDMPEEVIEALDWWVSDNVAYAIMHFWESDKPVCWIEEDRQDVVLTVAGPPKPAKQDDLVQGEIYTARFDVLQELKEYGFPYGDEGPRHEGKAQCQDVRDRAAVLRKFAADVIEIADRAEALLNQPSE